MTSKIKHLQIVRLYLSTHVTNTKSITPNQLRHRVSGFKGFRHTPLGPCSGFEAKLHDFIFLFLLFFFFLEDYIGLQLWVTQNYPRLPTYLRPDGPGVSSAAADIVCRGGDGGDICRAGLLCMSGSGAGISSVWRSSAT